MMITTKVVGNQLSRGVDLKVMVVVRRNRNSGGGG